MNLEESILESNSNVEFASLHKQIGPDLFFSPLVVLRGGVHDNLQILDRYDLYIIKMI